MALAQDQEAPRRRRALWPTGFRIHPPVITILIISTIVATAWRTGVFHHNLGLTTEYQYAYSGRQIQAGHWSTLFTNQLLTRNTFMCLSICLSVLVFVGFYEALAGSVRAIVVIVVTGIVGPLGVEAALGLGNVLGSTWAANTLSTLDFGASAITAGGAGAVVALLRWRWLRIIALLIVLSGLPLHHQLADWEHLISFTFGFGLGLILGPRPEVAPDGQAGGARRAGRTTPLAWVLLVPAAVLGVFASTTFISTAASGSGVAQLEDTTYPAPSVGGNRHVLVLLPPGYGKGERYPVVELLHGAPGDPQQTISLGLTGLSNASKTPFIGVAPDGNGPAVSESDFANSTLQQMGTATGPELRSWVDKHYSTNGTWTVTGLSSGGFGSAYLPTLTPGAYQAACPMSGFFTAEPPAFPASQPTAVKQAASPILHVSKTGPRTLLVVGNADKDGVNDAHNYIAAMNKVGQPNQLIVDPGEHDLPVWTAGLKQCLAYFFPASGLHG
ncbi:MAG TPA: alpha/beta hydrolase-fold protein [Acidimicrobiales bacterium]